MRICPAPCSETVHAVCEAVVGQRSPRTSGLSQLDRNHTHVCVVSGMWRRYRELLKLTSEEREALTRQAQSRTLLAGDVFRARLILALAAGKSYGQIETELQTSRPTIAR